MHLGRFGCPNLFLLLCYFQLDIPRAWDLLYLSSLNWFPKTDRFVFLVPCSLFLHSTVPKLVWHHYRWGGAHQGGVEICRSAQFLVKIPRSAQFQPILVNFIPPFRRDIARIPYSWNPYPQQHKQWRPSCFPSWVNVITTVGTRPLLVYLFARPWTKIFRKSAKIANFKTRCRPKKIQNCKKLVQ